MLVNNPEINTLNLEIEVNIYSQAALSRAVGKTDGCIQQLYIQPSDGFAEIENEKRG